MKALEVFGKRVEVPYGPATVTVTNSLIQPLNATVREGAKEEERKSGDRPESEIWRCVCVGGLSLI